MPTIRFEDIYFADHYNYIYCSYFLIFCSSLHNVTNWENFRHMMVYVNGTIQHMSDLESDPEGETI